MNFYENFVDLCIKAGKRPCRAATEMGMNKSVTTRWKNGSSKPTDTSLMIMAKYFGKTMEEMKDLAK